jgi:hypothetical protein
MIKSNRVKILNTELPVALLKELSFAGSIVLKTSNQSSALKRTPNTQRLDRLLIVG